MSPSYMNQRPVGEDKKVIPSTIVEVSPDTSAAAEQIAFDKANRAELIENEKQKLTKDLQEMESLLKDSSGEDREQIKLKIARVREHLEAMEHKHDELNQEGGSVKPTAARNVNKPRQ